MKYWIHLLIILGLGFIAQILLPWWIIMVIAFISAFIMNQKPIIILFFGLLAGFLLWGGVAFYLDIENHHLLSGRIGDLLGGLNSNVLIIITGILGGIIAGLSSFAGGSLRRTISQKH